MTFQQDVAAQAAVETPTPASAADVDRQWRSWGVIEVMVRNPSVDSFVREKEAEIERLSQGRDAVIEECAKYLDADVGRHPPYSEERAIVRRLARVIRALKRETPPMTAPAVRRHSDGDATPPPSSSPEGTTE